MRAVDSGIEGETAGNGIERPERAARFDRIGGNALVRQPLPHDMGGLRPYPVEGPRVPGPGDEGLVRGTAIPHQRGIRVPRPRRAGDRIERPVIHPDELRRIPGDRLGPGDDHDHRLADMAGPVGGQGGTGRHPHRRSVAPDRALAAAEDAEAVRRIVLTREHAENARDRPRRRRIDGQDQGVGVRRTHERRVRGVGRSPVIEEQPAPGQEPAVLAALYRSACRGRLHRLPAGHRASANSPRISRARARPSGEPLIWIAGSVTPVSR